MSRPAGYEARLKRIEETIEDRALDTGLILWMASIPKGSILDRIEDAILHVSGRPVAKRGRSRSHE